MKPECVISLLFDWCVTIWSVFIWLDIVDSLLTRIKYPLCAQEEITAETVWKHSKLRLKNVDQSIRNRIK